MTQVKEKEGILGVNGSYLCFFLHLATLIMDERDVERVENEGINMDMDGQEWARLVKDGCGVAEKGRVDVTARK